MLVKKPSAASTTKEAVWLDLCNPTDAERAEVQAATGLELPSRAHIEEIETSSRVYIENDALYLSTPMLTGDDCLSHGLTAVGFVLSRGCLVTLRFAKIDAFEQLLERADKTEQPSARDAFLKLLEAVVDHAADALEHAGADLENISHRAFRAETPRKGNHEKTSDDLRAALRHLGRMSDGISHLRDSMLGMGRIAAFVHETARESHLAGEQPRLSAIRGDVASLNDYQAHLAAKVQFLLDATLGFINIQQNDIVKTLTIVSVAGVPPVLIAGIYGMNFRVMPELTWRFGYPYALVLIVVSTLIPLAWLKWRGWM
ncbi:MAG TPA: magnesium transporter CorA family protein [Polyangiaceae bacterium]|nr:magnesium transporter CorA family protein [Polyangiaceae bacterium]